jgi:hypothetical protein
MNSPSSNDDTAVDRTPNVANESQHWSTFTPSSAIRIGLPETLDRLQSIKSMSPVDAHEIAWQMRQVIPCMLLLHLPNSPGLEIVTFLFFDSHKALEDCQRATSQALDECQSHVEESLNHSYSAFQRNYQQQRQVIEQSAVELDKELQCGLEELDKGLDATLNRSAGPASLGCDASLLLAEGAGAGAAMDDSMPDISAILANKEEDEGEGSYGGEHGNSGSTAAASSLMASAPVSPGSDPLLAFTATPSAQTHKAMTRQVGTVCFCS